VKVRCEGPTAREARGPAPLRWVGMVAACLVSVAASGGEVRPAKGYRLDLGPADGPVAAGFQALGPDTPYTRNRGYGWVGEGKRAAGTRHLLPDDLTSDCLFGITKTLRLDLPDGAYEMCVWTGSLSRDVPYLPEAAQGLIVSGERRVWFEPSAEALRARRIAWADADPQPGDDLWETYIRTRLPRRCLPVRVKGGTLEIGFLGSVPVSGLAVVPAGEVRPFLEGVEAARRKQFAGRFLPAHRADGAGAGVQALRAVPVDAMADVTPYEAPAESAWGLSGFAAPGSSVTMTVAVADGRDVTVRVSLGDLKGPGRARIRAAAADIRLVRYSLVGRRRYRWVEHALPPRREVHLRPGCWRRFWITLRVPKATPPGEYRGRFELRSDAGETRALPVRVRVMALSLPDLPPTGPVLAARLLPRPGRASAGSDPAAAFLGSLGLSPYVEGRREQVNPLLSRIVFPREEAALAAASRRDVVCLGAAVAGDYAHIAAVRARGAGLCLDGRGLERLAAGFLAWRTGADVVLVGTLLPGRGAAHHPLDGYRSEAGCLGLPVAGGWWPTVPSERARMGADDLRYQRLLDDLILRAERVLRTGRGPTAQRKALESARETARTMRERTRERVAPSLSLYRRAGRWPPAVYTRLRWRAAREAERLRTALDALAAQKP